MNRADAMCAVDLDGREPRRPTGYCISCGHEFHYPLDADRCDACAEKHEEFVAHINDPRR